MSQLNCINLADIDLGLSCAEQDNMGGIVPQVIYGNCDDVETWPTKPAEATVGSGISLEAAGTLVGDLVMKTGCRAYKFDFTDDTGSFTIKPQGEKGGESFIETLMFIAQKIRKILLGFMNATKGRKIFFLVKDNNGQWYLMGDQDHGAMLVADSEGANTGAAYTERNHVGLTFTYNTPRAFVYEGDTEDILTAVQAQPSNP